MKKIQKFEVKHSDKHFVVYVYSDPNVVTESMLVGPRYIVITTNNLTGVEVNSRIDKFFEINPACMKCRSKYYDNYFRVEIKPDGIDVVCGRCDPTVKFAVKYFELIDLILP